MKDKLAILMGWICLCDLALADPVPLPPQRQLSFTAGSSGTWNIDFDGSENRIYFVQWSLDLVTWHFAPFMEFGVDPEPYGVQTEGASKFFVRLAYYDDSSIESLAQAMNADFDNDGVSNMDEVTSLGTSPLLFATNGGSVGDGAQDWEGDGISNADEVSLGLDPGTPNTGGSTGSATVDYAYDDTNRLIGVTSVVSTKTYQLDPEGNIEGQ
ncbi:hypothetical protein [Luteolibacter luteus]|uniref:Uncharacterized protein n=1 Tax=Luteolibacter luteus TaxID=2728835 RepID=A0A858RFE2_9BACT|nr:hypothetical protein [Luteolibacter luteus]QJE95268.1 hypothetical protein HHL09_05580 [Luteolibacter luteus]